MKETMAMLGDIAEHNPCMMPDYMLKALSVGARFMMRKLVMNKQQAADYFGVSTKTIDRWREKHDFPCDDSNGYKCVSISVDKLIEWKKTHEDVWR